MPEIQLSNTQEAYCKALGIDIQNGTISESDYNRFKDLNQEQLIEAISGANKQKTITIDGKTFELSATNTKLATYLARLGYSDEEIAQFMEKSPDAMKLSLASKKQQAKYNNRTNSMLLLDADRYAKLDNFEKQEKIKDNTNTKLTNAFPKDKYPDLYKKDGTIKERKAWKVYEDQNFLNMYYAKKLDGLSEEQKKPLIDMLKQDPDKLLEQLKKDEKRVQSKLNSGYSLDQLSAEEQEIYNARKAAHAFKKDMKKFSHNVDKSVDRINNAIEKMNEWDWSMLNKEQQTKIVSEYRRYMNDQNNADPNGTKIEDIFDESGNLKEGKKNHLYQFVADYVTGTDAQVNKSKKKGNFFQKIFSKRNKEGTEKWAARELGLNKKDIEKMGFDWENQIGIGQLLADTLPATTAGALFGLAVSSKNSASDSQTATATASTPAQTINEDIPYNGYLGYFVNGELVQNLPYTGVVNFTKSIPGVFSSESQTATATANAKTNAVLPSLLISTGVAALNSLYRQGTGAQEKDIFSNRILQYLTTHDVFNVDDIIEKTGIKPGSDEEKIARDITKYYFDENGKFDSKTFATDWQYNSGYNSDYLNTSEAYVWLDQLRKNGGPKKPDVNVTVNAGPDISEETITNVNNNFFSSSNVQVGLNMESYPTEAGGVDHGLVNKYKKYTKQINYDVTEASKLSVNKEKALNTKGKGQYQLVLSTEGTYVRPRTLADGTVDYKVPQVVVISDNTNGKSHAFSYEYVRDDEKGRPLYKRSQAVAVENNADISTQHEELYHLVRHENGAPRKEAKWDPETGKIVIYTVYNYEYDFHQDNEEGTKKSSMKYNDRFKQ